MTERSQAIQVLKHARETLLARLAQLVVESEEEILDDAHGNSYTSQIESLHEQLGTRLASVNSLLAHLQSAENEPIQVEDEPAVETEPLELLVHAEAFQEGTFVDEAARHEPPTFDAFLRAIELDEMPRASRVLAELFGVDAARAEACAATFRDHYWRSPDFALRAHSLRTELTASVNGSLTLLWECFGLAVPESIEVLQTLRNRLDYA